MNHSNIPRRPVDRGFLAKIVDDDIEFTYEFGYNPTETESERTVEYSWTSAQGDPLPEAVFSRITPQKFTIQLFLDATRQYDPLKEGVNADIAALESFTWPDPDQFFVDLGQVSAPPQARLGLGGDIFPVVVESVRSRVVARNRRLQPMRAYVDVAFGRVANGMAGIQSAILRNQELTNLVVWRS